MISGRKGWKEKLKSNTFNGPVIWFHCASLGEFEQGRPLIEDIKIKHPNYRICLTFFSPSGYKVRKNYSGADFIGYLPFDNLKDVRTFIGLVNPTLAIFVKYEFWYNFLTELKRQAVPTFLISGIFREDQQFFKRNGRFFRKMLE